MIETIHWHTLHPRFLGMSSRVLDLGANYGQFTQAITRRFNCKCVAVEPSPEPFANIVETQLISKLHAAVTEKSGTMPFHITADSLASSLLQKTDSV
jgi:FkbM family methyltransferase